jgi:uncharacterized protein YcbX
MEKRQVGVVSELFRYPVKSMLGERLSEIEVGEKGVLGDRAWDLRERNGLIASAKKWPNLLDFRATYARPPKDGDPGALKIIPPGSGELDADDPRASETLSAALGREIELVRAGPDEHARAEINPQTIFGDVGVEQVLPPFTEATMPDSFALRRGGFFDSAMIHVLTTGSIEHMRSLIGADAQIDARRFRPNILVETDPRISGFIEDDWLDGALETGTGVRIVSMESALRCVMTTHRQSELPHDPRVLRTAAQHHQAKLGIFASIGAPGVIRLGDPVWLVRAA